MNYLFVDKMASQGHTTELNISIVCICAIAPFMPTAIAVPRDSIMPEFAKRGISAENALSTGSG